uniref:Uncharacterized protein n=1 Tax=Rhizophora mucronata TaxID=61149 RepID=A0A2P2P0Z3_RHIMU
MFKYKRIRYQSTAYHSHSSKSFMEHTLDLTYPHP